VSDPTVSVVMATHDRRELCRRAVASALDQDPAPLEVLVADDGSSDGTHAMLTAWAAEEPRLRVLPPAPPAGRPAPPRNRALALARGDWVAFLDDDDAWVPGKLAAQVPHMTGNVGIVAANARSAGGNRYFPEPDAVARLSRAAVLRGNPVILSTAVVRRDLASAAGGFPEARWLAGVEDYALWLAIADTGAEIVVLGEPLAVYAEVGSDRLSRRTVRNQVAVARLFWQRSRACPEQRELRRAAASKTSYVLTVARDALRSR
jgi:glycosyltransferase involved in cell wall biosynthesis